MARGQDSSPGMRARLSVGEAHHAGNVRHRHQMQMQIDTEPFLAGLKRETFCLIRAGRVRIEQPRLLHDFVLSRAARAMHFSDTLTAIPEDDITARWETGDP